MAAIICVTVVLPLLPVTATSGRSKRCRQAAASWPRARRESATSSPGRPASARPRSASAATAPAALAWARKSCASKRSPRKATNRSPERRVRVSLCTRVKASDGSPTRFAPGRLAAASPSVVIGAGAIAGAARAPRSARLGACGRIGERMLDAADVLVVLVALAGEQDHVGGGGRADGEADRLGPVLDHVDLVVADRADQDLREDEVGRLEPRVVAGDDHVLGQLDRDRAHQRPLRRRRGCRRSRTRTRACRRARRRAAGAPPAPSPAHRACGRSRPRPRAARPRRRRRPAASGPAPASAPSRRRPLRRGRRRGRAARRASPAGWRRCSRRSAAWRSPRWPRLRCTSKARPSRP